MLGGSCSPCCAPQPILCGLDSVYYTLTASVSITNIRTNFTGVSKLNASIGWLDMRNPLSNQANANKAITMPLVVYRNPFFSPPTNSVPPPNSFPYAVPLTYDTVLAIPELLRYTLPQAYRAGQPGDCYFRYNSTIPGTAYSVRKRATPSSTEGYVCPAMECFFIPALDGLTISVSGYLTGFCNFWPAGAATPVAPFEFHHRENAYRTAGGFAFGSTISFAGASLSQNDSGLSSRNLFASNLAGTDFNWIYDMTVDIVL